MCAKRIIPCLDTKGGRVVKGIHFFNLRDIGDPVELAKEYERQGADELVFLDITASVEGRKTIVEAATRVAEEIHIPLTVGGGVRTLEDIREILNGGASKVSINTAAVKNPEFVKEAADTFGSQCIVVAIDAKGHGRRTLSEEADWWEVYIQGGRTPTGLDAVEWAVKVEELGASEILLTSMDADGTRQGYDIPLLKQVVGAVKIPVIASGGAGSLEHIHEALTEGGADAALIASLVHFGIHTIGEIKRYLHGRGVAVKL